MRDETFRSLDPLRRLPELLAAAVPVTPEVLGPERALVSRVWLPVACCQCKRAACAAALVALPAAAATAAAVA